MVVVDKKKKDSLNVLMGFEVELGCETLTTLRANDRAGRVGRLVESTVESRRRRTESSSEQS